MKKWIMIVVWALVAFLVLGMVKDVVIKVAVEAGAQVVTGLKLRMKSCRVGMINTLVDIKKLRIVNPAGFKDKNMLVMPEAYVAYDLPAIFSGKVHLKNVRINLQEFTVVKNEKGQLNLDSLKVVQAQKSGIKPGEGNGAKAPEIQIDRLRLKIGKVAYKDYSGGREPRVTEYNINLDEEYTNITNPYTLVSLIVVKALIGTPIAGLTNFDVRGLSGSISGTLAGAEKAAAAATETAQKVQETASKASGALKDVLKNPFGGN